VSDKGVEKSYYATDNLKDPRLEGACSDCVCSVAAATAAV